jgi:heme exporter protein B
MQASRAIVILAGRELRVEFRSRELLSTTVVFSLIVVGLFNFAFEPASAEARRLAPGLLWIAVLFAGTLMLNPSFSREQINDTLSGLRMAPVPSFAIIGAKMISNLVFLMITEAVLVPVFSVLYNVGIARIAGGLLLVLLLGSAGIVIAGTVFSAISAQARMRELLLPLLALPALAPLLIAAVGATAPLFSDEPAIDLTWVAFLAGFDIVFLTAAWLLADYLLDE